MRRARIILVLIGVLGLLASPTATPADAQVPEVQVEALVTGRTDPPENPDGHTLGVNRVAGDSSFRSDPSDGFQIGAVVTCPASVHAARLQHPANHPVEFTADDDVTDGSGTVEPTEGSRAFSGPDEVGEGDIIAGIVSGSFHRLLGVVEVDLVLSVEVTDADGGTVCKDEALPFRVTFQLLPDNDTTPTEGFFLVGEGRRHGNVDNEDPDVSDRVSVARTVCSVVGPDGPRVDDPHDTVDSIPPGRGDFHPCGSVDG